MRYDVLVDSLLFRGTMFMGAILIFFFVFVMIPRELLRGRREGREFDMDSALIQHWGDIAQVAASARAGFPIVVGFLVTAIQMSAIAVMGSDLRFGDWRYWLQALAFVGVWILLAREIGWPNVLVPKELRGVPGLLLTRIRRRKSAKLSDNRIGGGETTSEQPFRGEKLPDSDAPADE